jgi:hypothetical protein
MNPESHREAEDDIAEMLRPLRPGTINDGDFSARVLARIGSSSLGASQRIWLRERRYRRWTLVGTLLGGAVATMLWICLHMLGTGPAISWPEPVDVYAAAFTVCTLLGTLAWILTTEDAGL